MAGREEVLTSGFGVVDDGGRLEEVRLVEREWWLLGESVMIDRRGGCGCWESSWWLTRRRGAGRGGGRPVGWVSAAGVSAPVMGKALIQSLGGSATAGKGWPLRQTFAVLTPMESIEAQDSCANDAWCASCTMVVPSAPESCVFCTATPNFVYHRDAQRRAGKKKRLGNGGRQTPGGAKANGPCAPARNLILTDPASSPVNPSWRVDYVPSSPLIFSSKAADLDMVETLLAGGSDINGDGLWRKIRTPGVFTWLRNMGVLTS